MEQDVIAKRNEVTVDTSLLINLEDLIFNKKWDTNAHVYIIKEKGLQDLSRYGRKIENSGLAWAVMNNLTF